MRELLRAKARAAMQKRDSSIQDAILDKLQEERKPVTVVIINGFQIKGRISASDRHVVVMDTDGKQKCRRGNTWQGTSNRVHGPDLDHRFHGQRSCGLWVLHAVLPGSLV